MGSEVKSSKRLVSTVLAIALVGCGAGGDDGDGGDPAASFAQKATFEAADIDHLLTRAEFGISATSRAEAQAMGLPAYVDQMLDFPTTGTTAVETAAAQYLVNGTDPIGLEGKFPSQNDITEWWLYLMLHSEDPFQERLALFLHDHFAVSSDVLNTQERYMMVDHLNKLRNNGIGSFKALVLLLSRDPAMLEWLDGTSNVKTDPNENFAREFFELFTVGADRGYTEEDVQEAARAFTGYRSRLDGGTNLRYIEFDETRKDVGAKVLFNDVVLRSNPATEDDYDLVVNATFATLDVEGWLAEKLCLEFITDSPSPAMIANLALVIRQHDYDMRLILRTLFLSQAFHAQQKTMVRMPVEYGVGMVRATGLMVAPDDMRDELNGLGQVPNDPPSVFGWPQGQEWLFAAGMVERANLARRLISERTFQSTNNYDVTMPPGTPDAAAVVDHLAGLMGVRLSDTERTTMIDYLDSNVRSGPVVEPDAFDPADTRHINERVRGLVYILASHPDALTR